MDLVTEAKAHRPGSINPKKGYPYTEDEIALALAWMRDEISQCQVATVMGKVHRVTGFYPSGKSKRWGGIHCFLAMSLREAVRRGLLDSDSYL